MQENEALSDLADIGAQTTERFLEAALARHHAQQRPTETPDEDSEGNRFCLDCADRIPFERVQAVQAVRCVTCVGTREHRAKMANRPGGGAGYPF